MYAALAAESECRLPARGKLEYVAHCKNAVFPDEPIRCLQRALGEYATVPRQVRERKLLEPSIENQLVCAGHGSRSHTRGGNWSLQSLARRLGDGDRRARRSVLFPVSYTHLRAHET